MCIEPCDTAVKSKIQPLLSGNQHDMNFKKFITPDNHRPEKVRTY